MANQSKLLARLTSPIALLLLATALAAGVALLAYVYLQKREESIKSELAEKSQKKVTPKVSVVVPKVDAKTLRPAVWPHNPQLDVAQRTLDAWTDRPESTRVTFTMFLKFASCSSGQ